MAAQSHGQHLMPGLAALLTPSAGLMRLTHLRLERFNDFGGQSLAALLPLAGLRRLQLSSITLNDAGLAAALEEAAESGCEEAHAEAQAAVLLPAVTHLALTDCHLLRCASRSAAAGHLPGASPPTACQQAALRCEEALQV